MVYILKESCANKPLLMCKKKIKKSLHLLSHEFIVINDAEFNFGQTKPLLLWTCTMKKWLKQLTAIIGSDRK